MRAEAVHRKGTGEHGKREGFDNTATGLEAFEFEPRRAVDPRAGTAFIVLPVPASGEVH